MRLPSVSYAPPWHGQMKPPAGVVGISVISFSPLFTVFCSSSKIGPPGCTGQPRCAQRLEMIVKLGSPFSSPLLRTKAVRRETSPCAGFSMKVATTYWPSREVGERADVDARMALVEEGGRDREADGGHRDDAADDGAEAERRSLEELRAREAIRGDGQRRAADVGGARRAGRPLGGALVLDRVRLGDQVASGRELAHPEEAEGHRDRGADPDDDPRRRPGRQQRGDADGEADGPQAGAWQVVVVVLRLH